MKVKLIEEDRTELERWVKSRSVGAKQRLRARMVLMTADGLSTTVIMATLGVSNPTLNTWRNRYLESGVEGLKKGKTHPSRIPPLSTDKVQEVLALTLTGKPCRHALELPYDGAAGRHFPDGGAWHLAGAQTETPSSEGLQGVERPAVRRKVARCRGPLPSPTGEGHRIFRRRKKPNPSTGSEPTRPADETGEMRDDDP